MLSETSQYYVTPQAPSASSRMQNPNNAHKPYATNHSVLVVEKSRRQRSPSWLQHCDSHGCTSSQVHGKMATLAPRDSGPLLWCGWVRSGSLSARFGARKLSPASATAMLCGSSCTASVQFGSVRFSSVTVQVVSVRFDFMRCDSIRFGLRWSGVVRWPC